MKIKEVTNPEEQLGLLRVIIDNTWSAIKQQADTHARQKAAQLPLKPKAKAPKMPKPAPYAAMPKPLLKPRTPYPSNSQYKAQSISSSVDKFSHKPAQSKVNVQKLPTNSITSPTNNEKDELLNLPRGVLPKPL